MSQSLSAAQEYMRTVRAKLDDIAISQTEVMAQAVDAITASVQADGMLYLFGTGHSHMLAEEGHYRAGGLAAVCPILVSGLMLHEDSVASGQLERLSGVVAAVLGRYPVSSNDSIMIFSNSGVNAVPVEMAMTAKDRGATVIAVRSQAYAATLPARAHGQKLADVADISIDNRGVPGDALVAAGGDGIHAGALSTIAGAFILNAILVEVVSRLSDNDMSPPVYLSGHLPEAAEHNARLVEKYRPRNPHL